MSGYQTTASCWESGALNSALISFIHQKTKVTSLRTPLGSFSLFLGAMMMICLCSTTSFCRLPPGSGSTAKLSRHRTPFTADPTFAAGNVSVLRKSLTTRRIFTVRASISPSVRPLSDRKLIIANSAVTVALAVANRVLYKLALVPMKRFPFFLAQLNTFGYVLIYFSILYVRYSSGIVNREMLAMPKWRFAAIGLLEALGVASGMAAAAMLPGPVIPILSQTFLVWQLGFAILILERRYSFNQMAGCVIVAVGVIVAVASGSNPNQMLSGSGFIWPAMMVASAAFEAGGSIIKEFAFVDGMRRLKGKSLDIFVVNSFGSGFQALFVFLLLPLLSNLKGIPFAELPSYLKSGAGCFLNIRAEASGCEGAPLLPLLYIAINLAFNTSLLNLVKISSAVVSSLVLMLSVPVSVYILSLPLPYLQEGSSLSPYFLFGSFILVFGLLLYNIPPANPHVPKTN